MYIRLHTVRGRNSQAYTYLEVVFARPRRDGMQQKQVCSLGRVEDLRRTGALENMIARLVRVAAQQPALTQSPKREPHREEHHHTEGGRTPVATVQDVRIKSLSGSPAFADLNERQLADLAMLATVRRVKAGQFMYKEGDLLGHFYVLTEGRLKIMKHSLAGKDFIVAFSGPGEVLGNVSLLSGNPHPYSAQAVLDTRALALRTDDLLRFLSSNPEAGFKFLRRTLIVITSRLTSAFKRAVDLAAERSEHRLAYTLFSLCLELGSTLPFTRQEIAEMAGTSTETAIRFINRLKEAGVVCRLRRKIIILDHAKLELLAGDSQQVFDKGRLTSNM